MPTSDKFSPMRMLPQLFSLTAISLCVNLTYTDFQSGPNEADAFYERGAIAMAEVFLEFWWISVIIFVVFSPFLLGAFLQKRLSLRLRLICGLTAAAIIALSFSPISFRGVFIDHLALSTACVVLAISIGTLGSLIRWAMAAIYALILGLPIFRSGIAAFGFVFGLVLGMSTSLPSREIDLGSKRVVRMQEYGWVAHSGTEIVVSAQLWSIPFEYELGRKQFSDETYAPLGINAKLLKGRTEQQVIITHDGQEIWRVP
jgi:hypothetical protein